MVIARAFREHPGRESLVNFEDSNTVIHWVAEDSEVHVFGNGA